MTHPFLTDRPNGHIYELRHGVDFDDWELGSRVATGFYGENVPEGWAPRYDIICFRGYLATGQRIKPKKK